MRRMVWSHTDVRANGKVGSGGSVETCKIIRASNTGKCWLPDCNCSKGLWLSINLGLNRATSTVMGVTCQFDNLSEFDRFMTEHNLRLDNQSGIVNGNLDSLEPILFDRNSLN